MERGGVLNAKNIIVGQNGDGLLEIGSAFNIDGTDKVTVSKDFILGNGINNQAEVRFLRGEVNADRLLIGKNVTNSVINDVVNGVQDPSQTVAVSSRFLEKGDFVRLQSASLGYNWPLSGEGLFDSLRLSFTGQNLFLITGYSGLDPEISINTGSLNASNIPSRGIDYASFPRPRTYTLGVNVTF